MRQTIRIITVPLTACMCMAGCAAAETDSSLKKAGSDLVIMQATDLHYLSDTLHDDGAYFTEMMTNGDGKLSEYSEQILDALVTKAVETHPDAFLLSGDITFNGEKQSLVEVKRALEKIKDAGIPVLVIPGNHDIDYPYAFEYSGEEASPVANVSQSDFQETMQEFGYEDALARDDSSFSYVYPLSQDVWLLAMDANTENNPGSISDTTMTWLEEQLKQAQAKNIKVITMSHQNVLKQNELLYRGYVMDNYEEVNALLKKYNVTLNLSGHSHLEHVAEEDGLTDACTESLALYPLQYAAVSWRGADSTFDYSLQSLGILQDESYQRFRTLTEKKINKSLKDLDISAEEKQIMLDFAVKANIKYFTGSTEGLAEMFQEEGWTLWKTYGGQSSWIGYMESIREAQ